MRFYCDQCTTSISAYRLKLLVFFRALFSARIRLRALAKMEKFVHVAYGYCSTCAIVLMKYKVI